MDERREQTLKSDIPDEPPRLQLNINRRPDEVPVRPAMGPFPTSIPNDEMTKLSNPVIHYGNEEELKRKNLFWFYPAGDSQSERHCYEFKGPTTKINL